MDTSPAPVQDAPKSQIPLFLTVPRILLLLIAIAIMAAGVFVFATVGNYPGGVTGYTPINLSQEEKQWISDHPVVWVCPDSNYPPFEMISERGEYEGIAADLLREIAQITGLTLGVVMEPDWNRCVGTIQEKKADILGAVYISNLRSEYLIYSEPYYHSLLPIITRDDGISGLTLADLAGKRVASVRGFTTTLLLREKYPNIVIDEVPDVKTGLEHISLGSADAYFGDLAASTWYVDREGFSNLHVSGSYKPENTGDFSYAFGIRKDYPELAGIINKGIHAIPMEKREEIFKRWISPTLRPSAVSPAVLMVITGIAGLLLLISFLVIVWNRTLKKVVTEKTEDLLLELQEHKKTSQALTLTRTAVDHSRAMILWLDESGVIRDVNETICNTTGLSRNALIGAALGVCIPRYRDPDIPARLLAKVKEEGYVQIESVVTQSDGRDLPVAMMVWYFPFEGGGMFGVEMLDISGYKNSEREREAAIRQIERNMAELSVLNDGIRNPLTVILGTAESYPGAEYQIIEREVTRIDQTITQLDSRWMESEKILSYLKKHYAIDLDDEKPG